MKNIIYENPKNKIKILLNIWENSVRNSHFFLTNSDILKIKDELRNFLDSLQEIICYEENEKILGFMIVINRKIEALFIDSTHFKKGIGKKLVNFAFKNLSVNLVDVNEQNPNAILFYKKMGFKEFDRSDFDESGNPFPIIHMKTE